MIIKVECIEDYVWETVRRISQRVDEHSGKDDKSNVLRHSYRANHTNVSKNNFKILDGGYKKNNFKRKLSEALYIKELRPSLNTQETSVSLKLFNWLI